MPSRLSYVWLSLKRGLGSRTAAEVLDAFGSPEAVFAADRQALTAAPCELRKTHVDLLCDKDTSEAEQVIRSCTEKNIQIITIGDSAYPDRLRAIPDPPTVLYVRGRWPDFDSVPAVAVVGTRKATPYGLKVADQIGTTLARAGMITVSGMALGNDGAAHRGALKAGGLTVAVLAGGPDVCYPPQHRSLMGDILLMGAIISEYPPGTEPHGRNYHQRNRIISGLSVASVIVEASDWRSGALITARHALDQGDKLTAEKIEPSQHFTQPPARYTEASLIRAMEERGIGRPSTYAPTISTIIDRDYVTKENKALRPTPLGEGVTGLLVDEFKSVADYEFTANMEHELDEVEAGKLNYIQLLHNFYDGFEAALKQAEVDLEGKRIKIQDEVTDVICEKCGRNMVIKSGRFGKFLACPGFPECTNTKPITEDTGAACPVCGAKVVKKKSARGYVYYSCDTYPTCQFMTWDKPLKTKCPNCDSSLFRHTDRDSKEVTDVCLREGCGYKELVKEGLPPEEAEKRRKMREARAAKAAERAAAKEAAEKNGETEEKVKKATKKATTKKSTAKKTLPWMTKTTNKFKKLKDEAVQELTAKQQEQYAKALAKYEAEKAAEKAKKAAEKKAAAKKPAAKKKTTAKESAE